MTEKEKITGEQLAELGTQITKAIVWMTKQIDPRILCTIILTTPGDDPNIVQSSIDSTVDPRALRSLLQLIIRDWDKMPTVSIEEDGVSFSRSVH